MSLANGPDVAFGAWNPPLLRAPAVECRSYAVSAWMIRSMPFTSCSSSIRKPIARCTTQAIAPETRKA